MAMVVVLCSGGAGDDQQQLRRRSANYEPSSWDYDSICSSPTQQTQQQQQANHDHHLLINRVRRLLLDDATTSSSRRLRLIHELQSVGVAYHFREEIRDILVSIHHHALSSSEDGDLDLHSAALLFRLLRGHGIPASTDMLLMRPFFFFSSTDNNDDSALHALYEASYLAFPGETVLDEARALAVQSLPAVQQQQQQLPLHWTAPRLQAMWSLKKQQQAGDYETLLVRELARADFNLVQSLHRRELAEVTRWWKHTGLQLQGEFARDRVAECFFCAACIAPEPELVDCREVLAKAGALIVYLDDIYDVYGTPEELQAFTDAIAAWDCSCSVVDAQLPEYMKAMYKAIWETSTTAADRVLRKQGCNVLPLYKKAWHELCKAFLTEARWHRQGYRPSLGEYLANGWVTSTGPLLLLHALPAAGAATGAPPRLVELASTIFRLCNDGASHQAESARGDAPSSIACCMAEAWCTGEGQARAAVQGLIADTWKALNKEATSVAAQSVPMAMAADLCLNLARIIHCIYKDGDGITSPTHRMKHMVKDLLFNPI